MKINLATNCNPYMPNLSLKLFLARNLFRISQYPSANVDEISYKLAKVLNLPQNTVVVVNGTMEAIDFILKTLNKKKLGFFSPTFWGAEFLSHKYNYQIVKYELDKYTVDSLNQLAKHSDIIYLCNPNNPNLTSLASEEIKNVIKNNPKTYFIIDETIQMFDENFESVSLMRYVGQVNNACTLISLSKILSLGGLRIGILISNKKWIEQYRSDRLVYSSNVLGELIINKYCDKLFRQIKKDRLKIKRNLNFFYHLLKKKNVQKFIQNNGSFCLVEFKEKYDSNMMTQYLDKHGFCVRNLKSEYGFKTNSLRISSGTLFQMIRLAHIINHYCSFIDRKKNLKNKKKYVKISKRMEEK